MTLTEKNTETQILEAAKTVFQRKGMTGARMQEIADEAGINKALLHYYYRSKELLFKAVFKSTFLLVAPALKNILNGDSSIEQKIRDFTGNYIGFISKYPYIPNFIFQEINRDPKFIEELLHHKDFPNIDKFRKQVQVEVEQGRIRPISAEQLFVNVLSLSVFPFIGAPLIKGVMKITDQEFIKMIEMRKTQVADFIIDAIKI